VRSGHIGEELAAPARGAGDLATGAIPLALALSSRSLMLGHIASLLYCFVLQPQRQGTHCAPPWHGASMATTGWDLLGSILSPS
jgi:hypothetical protein